MERTIVTRVRDFGAFTVDREQGEIIVYIPKEHIPQLKTQFQVTHPEELRGKAVFVNLPAHRIYSSGNKCKDIGVYCNMEVLWWWYFKPPGRIFRPGDLTFIKKSIKTYFKILRNII